MLIRAASDLGATIRDHRRRRGLDQHELAKKIGVSRQWIVEVEKGKPRAEVGLVLRALDALGVVLSVAPSERAGDKEKRSEIDEIIDRAREPES